jgi:hypothetical protein
VAHSTPDGIANHGDAWRVTTAGGAFIIELVIDKRVKALYKQWYHMRAQVRSDVHRTIDVMVARGDDKQQIKGWLGALGREQFAAQLAATERFVTDELKLSFPWVPRCLLDAFNIRVWNEEHPNDPPRQFKLPVKMQPEAPKGRKPRNDGKDLERAVRWYYRNKVQDPPDSVHELARDYALSAERDNDSRSVVQNAIDQVQTLLDLVSQRFVVLK